MNGDSVRKNSVIIIMLLILSIDISVATILLANRKEHDKTLANFCYTQAVENTKKAYANSINSVPYSTCAVNDAQDLIWFNEDLKSTYKFEIIPDWRVKQLASEYGIK